MSKAAKTGAQLIRNFIESAGKKTPSYGKLKSDLSIAVRKGEATAAEKQALDILNAQDEAATLRQKAASAKTRGKDKPVSLAGPKRFGGQGTKMEKSYGGSMKKKTTKRAMGGKIGRGCGAATKGGGAVMK